MILSAGTYRFLPKEVTLETWTFSCNHELVGSLNYLQKNLDPMTEFAFQRKRNPEETLLHLWAFQDQSWHCWTHHHLCRNLEGIDFPPVTKVLDTMAGAVMSASPFAGEHSLSVIPCKVLCTVLGRWRRFLDL